MFDVETTRFQFVLGGFIPLFDGPLDFYKPLPTGMIGINEDGKERHFRVLPDIMVGTVREIVRMVSHNIGTAAGTLIRGAEENEVSGRLLHRLQNELTIASGSYAYGTPLNGKKLPRDIANVRSRFAEKLLLSHPQAFDLDDGAKEPGLRRETANLTPALARETAKLLLEWADQPEPHSNE